MNTGINSRRYDLIGKVFGRLIVIDRVVRGTVVYWGCMCQCGTIKYVSTGSLSCGRTVSCGCYARERSTKHGASANRRRTPEYYSWCSMITRCYNFCSPNFSNYGGRGIIVCVEWLESFSNFLADMGERPAGTTLDRIDVDGNYEPSNCRWATHKQQALNKRNNRKI